MATERKAYSCDYKCGQKVVLSKKSMEDHETRCFHNPDNRACASCKFFEIEHDGNGMEGTPYNHEWTDLICNAKDIAMDKLTSKCDLHEPK